MIVGVGTDLAEVARFTAACRRTPALLERIFAPGEVDDLRPEQVAARFAAKEALAKALGAPGTLAWHDARVVRSTAGVPSWDVRGTITDRMAQVGATRLHLSLSHDGGFATALVVAEGEG